MNQLEQRPPFCRAVQDHIIWALQTLDYSISSQHDNVVCLDYVSECLQ